METLFYRRLRARIAELGGMHNAHLHLDRANTLDDGYVDHGKVEVLQASHISLQKKHALIATVHDGPAYDRDDLVRRVGETTDVMVAAGTTRGDTMVDVTADRVGTDALEWVMEYARARNDKINIQAAAYTPLGFKDSQPEQWDIFAKGVAQADFIGSLPEADDRNDYPDNIGFEEHCRRMLELAQATGKMLHVHTDQLNLPEERGTERLIEAMRAQPVTATGPDGEPLVWAVHMISPSTYEDARWDAFVDGLLECNIGVICCPSAAIGMRQLRPRQTATYNSIPRILELAAAGVHIRLGSDNVADMCSPSTTADLMDEVFVLSGAVRYFQPDILAKLACGVKLSAEDRAEIAEHLRLNDAEIAKLLAKPLG